MAAVKFAYLGNDARFYSQYLDVTGPQMPLTAEPGGEYAIIPVPGYEPGALPVPPADGRWGPARETTKDTKAPASKTVKEASV